MQIVQDAQAISEQFLRIDFRQDPVRNTCPVLPETKSSQARRGALDVRSASIETECGSGDAGIACFRCCYVYKRV